MAERERKKALTKEVRPACVVLSALNSRAGSGRLSMRRRFGQADAGMGAVDRYTLQLLKLLCMLHLLSALQEKAELKRKKDEAEAGYKFARIDGRLEQVRLGHWLPCRLHVPGAGTRQLACSCPALQGSSCHA